MGIWVHRAMVVAVLTVFSATMICLLLANYSWDK